jgi:hypothetical protein
MRIKYRFSPFLSMEVRIRRQNPGARSQNPGERRKEKGEELKAQSST